MEEAIICKALTFSVENRTILQNISGSFQKGRITALVGPSGAGKSTLLKMFNALLSPTSGEIFIDGKEIRSYEPTELRKKVGFALQNAPMISKTVYDNLRLPYQIQGKVLEQDEAVRFLNLVGLDANFLHTAIDDLSGGERQRVSLARTLIHGGTILLLDEITSALDEQAAFDIERLIIRLKKEQDLTIIWITHQIEQAKRCADDVWILIDGKLAESGTTAILSHSTNKEVEQFIHGGSK